MIRRSPHRRSRRRRPFTWKPFIIWVQSIWEFSKRENIPKLLGIVLAIILTSSLLLFWVEPDASFADSLGW